MTYFLKTAYWIPLFPNVESLYNTTNPHFKNNCALSVAEDEEEIVLVENYF